WPRRPQRIFNALNREPVPLDRLLGSSSTTAHAIFGSTIFALHLTPEDADFDRDGLRASEEARLGTSDLNAATDGAGADDVWEVRFAGTDPTHADPEPPHVGALSIAPSLFAQWFPSKLACKNGGFPSWASVICDQGMCLSASPTERACELPDR